MGGRSSSSGMSGRGAGGIQNTTGFSFVEGNSIRGFNAGTNKQTILNTIDNLEYSKEEDKYGTTYQIGVEVKNPKGGRNFYDTAFVFVSKSSGQITLNYTSTGLGGAGKSSKFKTLDGAMKSGKKRLKASVNSHYSADGNYNY